MLLKMVSANPHGEWIGLGSHYLTSALNGGLSVVNNQYHRLLVRSKGKYKSVYHRRHSKTDFRC